MANRVINIADGVGSKNLIDGLYNASSQITVYDNSTFHPTLVTVTSDVITYNFTIKCTGEVTITVTDDGSAPAPVAGAKFIRCDAAGNVYGDPIVTDELGHAAFVEIPFSPENGVTLYYKQTETDREHTFDSSLQSELITAATQSISITNNLATERQFIITGEQYPGLKVGEGYSCRCLIEKANLHLKKHNIKPRLTKKKRYAPKSTSA